MADSGDRRARGNDRRARPAGKASGGGLPVAGAHGALLAGELARPGPAPSTKGRRAEIVAAARRILDDEGQEALSMRRLAQALGIQAPSLYRHFDSKAALELALIEDGLEELGEISHRTLHESAPKARLESLLGAYRAYSLSHPHLYRLATGGPLARECLRPHLEAWAGNPWFVVAGDPVLAQALWSFAHGMVMLELDARYPPGSDLPAIWRAGARAFEQAVPLRSPNGHRGWRPAKS